MRAPFKGVCIGSKSLEETLSEYWGYNFVNIEEEEKNFKIGDQLWLL